jgi:hypothetical protein
MKKTNTIKNYLATIVLISLLAVSTAMTSSCTTSSTNNGLDSIDAKTLPSAFAEISSDSSFAIVPDDIEIATEMPQAPDKMIVYKVIPLDDAYTRDIAFKLGFSDSSLIEINPDKNGGSGQIYNAVNGDATLEVSSNGYFAARYGDSPSLDSGGVTLSEQECITKAQEWLKSHNLYPDEVSRTATGPMLQVSTHNTETGYRSENTVLTYGVSFFTRIGDYESSLPAAYVEIDTNGEIIEVDLHMQQLKELGYVNIITAEEAFNSMQSIFDSEIRNHPENSGCMINITDFSRLSITKVSIQYSKKDNYVQPIYFFYGTAYYNDSLETTEEFRGRVDAVIR